MRSESTDSPPLDAVDVRAIYDVLAGDSNVERTDRPVTDDSVRVEWFDCPDSCCPVFTRYSSSVYARLETIHS